MKNIDISKCFFFFKKTDKGTFSKPCLQIQSIQQPNQPEKIQVIGLSSSNDVIESPIENYVATTEKNKDSKTVSSQTVGFRTKSKCE